MQVLKEMPKPEPIDKEKKSKSKNIRFTFQFNLYFACHIVLRLQYAVQYYCILFHHALHLPSYAPSSLLPIELFRQCSKAATAPEPGSKCAVLPNEPSSKCAVLPKIALERLCTRYKNIYGSGCRCGRVRY